MLRSAPASVPVAFYGGVSPAMAYFTTVSTTRSLLPGEFELVSAEFTLATGSEYDDHQFQVVVNDPLQTPTGSLVECRSGNNTASGTAVCFSFE